MACPHVAGTAALILQSEPDLTPQQVAERMQSAATSDAVKDRMTGSPDSFLYTGDISARRRRRSRRRRQQCVACDLSVTEKERGLVPVDSLLPGDAVLGRDPQDF